MYPWLITASAFLSLFISNGIAITGLSVYDPAILEEFGWSRGALKFRDMFTRAGAGLLAPIAGIAIDRFGVKICMTVGWILLLLACYLYSVLESLTGLYIIHTLMAITLVCCGLTATVVLVSRWFVKWRGTAIGIMLMGSSLGGVFFPQWGSFMLDFAGWRGGYQWVMLFPLFMLFWTFFIVKNSPQKTGNEELDARHHQNLQSGLSYGQALRTKELWLISFIAMTTFYTVLGMQAHLVLYMTDLGVTVKKAAYMVSLFFLFGMVGKFIFGFLADHLPGKSVFYGNLAVMLSGSVTFTMAAFSLLDPSWIKYSVIAFGLGWGGAYSMLQLTVMNCFGIKAAGKILGTITLLDAIGGGLGIWLTGLFFDIYGSYELPFALFTVLVVIAILCLTQVRMVNKAEDLLKV